MSKYEKGKLVSAKVTGIESYGIFVSLDESYSGLIHISEISNGFVKNINKYVKIGESINAQIVDVDEKASHLKLSLKGINYKECNETTKNKIVETLHGFDTLRQKLPFWVEKGEKKYKKNSKPIDN